MFGYVSFTLKIKHVLFHIFTEEEETMTTSDTLEFHLKVKCTKNSKSLISKSTQDSLEEYKNVKGMNYECWKFMNTSKTFFILVVQNILKCIYLLLFHVF